ncbi:Uncharacterised protein [Alysiella crassa]|uniref:Uncharacterized protein n=1 Tax=Alysiella crassa TaxID=153491 RepID=A0A376BKS5_9NEIS|nr:Uncharacterised protein [Alysiella crassa]
MNSYLDNFILIIQGFLCEIIFRLPENIFNNMLNRKT